LEKERTGSSQEMKESLKGKNRVFKGTGRAVQFEKGSTNLVLSLL
jgi:hypothetical protein